MIPDSNPSPGASPRRLRIVLVEDKADLRESWSRLINSFPDFSCVGVCSSGEEALRAIPSIVPDVVLMASGETNRYRSFSEATIDTFAATTNGDAAGRILKTCLLLPADRNLMERLQPLGGAAESFAAMYPNLSSSWAAIPVSLWRYRVGDYDKAVQWCRRGLNENDKSSAQYATFRIILAMSCWKSGQTNEARGQLEQGREAVETQFKIGLQGGDAGKGYWYDWVFARILLREAPGLTGSNVQAGAEAITAVAPRPAPPSQ